MESLLAQIGLPLIAVIVPLILAGVKSALPLLPRSLLPVAAGALGPAVEALLAWLGGFEFTGVAGVAMGLAGVGLREVKDQIGKALRSALEPPALPDETVSVPVNPWQEDRNKASRRALDGIPVAGARQEDAKFNPDPAPRKAASRRVPKPKT